MKITEILKSNLGVMTLNEADEFILEMANFLADVTELPANIVLWTETQPSTLPHTKYRMKVYKERVHSSTFSIGKLPIMLWQVNNKKFRLLGGEITEVQKVISEFASLFIQYVDGKITPDQVKFEIKKVHGVK